MISTQFCKGSAVSGALFSFVFLTEDGGVDFNRSALLALDRNTSLNHTLPFNLHPGHYRVYVYDIEQDGTLSNGVQYPAVTNEFKYNNDSNLISTDDIYIWTKSCQIDTLPHLLTINCTKRIQVIAQLSNASEVQKLYVNQSMDPHTPVTVEVERDGLYRITIFPITDQDGIYSEDIMSIIIICYDIMLTTTVVVINSTDINTTGICVCTYYVEVLRSTFSIFTIYMQQTKKITEGLPHC